MSKQIATIQRTNEILTKFDLHAKKGFGQNFIIDPNIVNNIGDKADLTNACAIEIGPGIGALTEVLAKNALHVYAFEIDTKLKDVLAYSLEEYDNVDIIFEDFLKIDLETFIKDLRKTYDKIVVCANLPYYITTPLLFKLFECPESVDCITVMMQKEVADRFSAKVNSADYNALSVISQYLFDIKVVLKIPRTIFNPKPNVDSAVVQFSNHERLEMEDVNDFFEFVKGCFKQRRKTLYNNLREYTNDKELSEKVITSAGHPLTVRAQECSLEQFKQLYEVYRNER